VLRDLLYVWSSAEYHISGCISHRSLTVQLCDCWINELKKIDSCLYDYFTATVFLHVASRVAKYSLSNDMLDVLTILVGQFVVK